MSMRDSRTVRWAAFLALLFVAMFVLEGCRKRTNSDYQAPEERPRSSIHSEGS